MRAGFLTAVLLCGAATFTAPACASVEISANPTHDMNCTGGVCAPTAKNADLNTTDLANMLAAGDVKVMTGNGAVTITVTAPFSWTSSHRLTLDANLNLSFKAPVIVAGQRAVTIVTNDGSTGGDLIFFDGGKLDFWDSGSSLIINSKNYKLVGDLDTLASDIRTDPFGSYALSADYDASVNGVYKSSPVGTPLAGSVEGLGHAIGNLTIKAAEAGPVGLFQEVRGTVRDLELTNANVRGKGYGGTLVGANTGVIARCSANGIVSLPGDVGGLVGLNSGSVLISHAASKTVGGVGAYVGG